MLDGELAPDALIDLALRSLPRETDELNVQQMLGSLSQAYWRFTPAERRVALAPRVERTLRAGLAAARTPSLKGSYFSTLRDTALTPPTLAWLTRVWERQAKVPGLTLAENDEIALAQELALREVPGWKRMLEQQVARTKNPDRKARLRFVMPALSSDPAERRAFFESLRDAANRQHEPWVLDGLRSLHHPLRADSLRGVHPAEPRAPAGDSAHRRHLLPEALDGRHARRTSVARRRADRQELRRRAARRPTPTGSGASSSRRPTTCSAPRA